MPILTAYFGLRTTAFCFFDEAGKRKNTTYNFSYSPQIHGFTMTRSQFIESLVKQYCTQNKISLAKTRVYLTGYADPGQLKFEFISMESLLSEGTDTDIFFSDDTLFATNQQIHHSCYLNHIRTREEKNSKLNRELYALKTEPETLLNEINDGYIKFLIHTRNLEIKQLNLYKNVVFAGTRFHRRDSLSPSDIRLIVDICSWDDVVHLQLDNEMTLMSMLLLKKKEAAFYSEYSDKFGFRDLGTLINVYGESEILVISDDGTHRLFDLKDDRIFIIPLDYDERVKVKVKRHNQSEKEFIVSGGSYGLIFDSRDKRDPLYLKEDINDKFWLSCKQELSESLSRI